MQTESAHMIMPYWERQMKRVDNPTDGMKFKALGKKFIFCSKTLKCNSDCPYRTFQEANQSIKDKRKKVIRWMYEVRYSKKTLIWKNQISKYLNIF